MPPGQATSSASTVRVGATGVRSVADAREAAVRMIEAITERARAGDAGLRQIFHAAGSALAHWLVGDSGPEIIADWPEDLSQLAMLLVSGPGEIHRVPPLTLRYVPLPGFSTARNSAVPHNALHDARALRDHIMTHLD